MRLWPLFILGLSVVLGTALRILPLNDRDYWYDEAFTGIAIRQPWPDMMHIITHDVHPPMYYWLLRGWAAVVGDGPMDLRAFSVAFGVATIVLAYVVLRHWEPRSFIPATVGAFVVAINPFLISYSQEARMYSVLAFLILLAAFLVSTNRRWTYSVVVLLILLTHYLGAVFVGCMFLWDITQHRLNFRWLFSGYLIPLIGGALWLPSFLEQMSRTNGLSWVPEVTIARVPITIATFLFGAPVGVPGIPPVLGFQPEWLHVEDITVLSIVVLTALSTAVSVKKRWDGPLALAGLLTFAPLLITLAIQLIDQRLFVERYLIGSGLFLLIFCAMALHRMSKAWLAGSLALYALLVATIQPWQHGTAFQNLNTEAFPQTVVFTSTFDFTVGRYYLGEDVDTLLFHVTNVHENFEGWTTITGHQIYSLPTNDHVIVTSSPEVFADTYQVIDRSGYLTVLKPL